MIFYILAKGYIQNALTKSILNISSISEVLKAHKEHWNYSLFFILMPWNHTILHAHNESSCTKYNRIKLHKPVIKEKSENELPTQD